MNTDPTRKIGSPMLGTETVQVVERSPTGVALIGQTLTRFAVALNSLAIGLGGVFYAFTPLPWAVTGVAVCAGIVALTQVITGASPGIRKHVGVAPVVESVTTPKLIKEIEKHG